MTSIVGWSHTKFGKLAGETVESLLVQVIEEAVEHAGIDYKAIDEIIVGHFNANFSRQDFTAALALHAAPELRFTPSHRVENACASGSAALFSGLRAIESGEARIALVVGVEKMTDAHKTEVAANLLRASYMPEENEVEGGFAGVFGQTAAAYFSRFGEQLDALAAIAAKNHRNGVDNPFAQIQKDFGFEFCRTESAGNPYVAGPLKRTDCSPVSDGAAALIVTDDATARTMRRSVRVRGRAHVNDYMAMSRRERTELQGVQAAWSTMMERAGLTLADLSFAEVHDCFTIAELMEYEAIGLTALGEGYRAAVEGWTAKEGRLPINPSGGLKAKGHPIGATGVSMHVLTAMQLCGEAPGAMQLADPQLGAVMNMGGTGVANYASVLERVY